jgi:hypothetical protein
MFRHKPPSNIKIDLTAKVKMKDWDENQWEKEKGRN